MTADLKPYPKMSLSGIEWIGKVPEHWNCRRLRNITDMRVSNVDKHTKEGEQPVRLCNYVDVYKNDKISSQMAFMKATATPDEIKSFRLAKDDVLITKDSETWDDIGVPALVIETAQDLISGYHLAILRSNTEFVIGSYLFRAMQSKPVAFQLYIEAKGVTRYGLSHSGIKSIWLPIPPLPEQATIVKYLDYMNSRIRRYIRAKQKLIKLLEEQKQAIIHQAVTCGLNPDAKMKNSGVEWLGKVPEHWEIINLGKASSLIQTGPFGSQLHSHEYITGGIPLINPSHMKDGKIIADNDISISQLKADELKRHKLSEGDIIVARRGELGRCAIVSSRETNWICGTGSMLLKLRSEFYHPSYLVFLISSQGVRDTLCLASIGSTMDNLNSGMLSRLRLPMPRIHEQKEIMQHIESKSNRINKTICKTKKVINCLKEYETSVISKVISGQLDVREAAEKLPEIKELDNIELENNLEIDGDVTKEMETVIEEAEA